MPSLDPVQFEQRDDGACLDWYSANIVAALATSGVGNQAADMPPSTPPNTSIFGATRLGDPPRHPLAG